MAAVVIIHIIISNSRKVCGEDMYLGVSASLNHKSGCDYLYGKYAQKWTKDETTGKTNI